MKYLFFALLIACGISVYSQQDISQARATAIGQNVTVSGIVTNGSELGPIRYIQDYSAGIAAYGSAVSNIKRGDSVTISGTLKNYRNLLELDPINSVVVHSSENLIPDPIIITVGEIGEKYEGQLIRINGIVIENASGSFQNGTNYSFTDGSDISELRISSGLLIGKTIPTGNFDLVGICSQFSYNSNDTQTGYQILPRDEGDIVISGAVKVIAPLVVTDFSKSEITLSWQTDVEGYSCIIYGSEFNQSSLNNLVVAASVSSAEGFLNEATVTGLDPATVIYAQGYTIVGNDTAFTGIRAFGTESNSTGNIEVYFNTEVDHSVATNKNAEMLYKSFDEKLIEFIDEATESIDLAIYNINNSGISNITDALNNAHNRGVKVRAITCGTTAHFGLDNSGSDIPDFSVLAGPDDNEREGIMHNKFMIIDASSENAERPIVWTGSTNLTEEQVDWDANNMVFIQDQTLAKAYTIEFEEMWGGNGLEPDLQNSKFGNLKTDNTPHEFKIGSKRVECYFSPSDGTNQKIIETIESSDIQLDVATMLITRSDIADAIEKVSQNGVKVHIITNVESSNSTTVNNILENELGNNYIFDNVAPYILHNKYAIVDHFNDSSDPLVLTGSHNWSSAANDNNDENTLIIHDEIIANLYYQNFVARFTQNNGVINASELINLDSENIKVYPVPAIDVLNITSNSVIKKVEIFNISGVLLKQEITNSDIVKFSTVFLMPGIYFIKVIDSKGNSKNIKILKE
ncbi:MAG: T9SS type A sorting domain-containing protein [Prolixibacteraceae bacterium]|nr:T9SS type A sorting domain-containing protein [Prolixibacteraceae bacterium]